MEQQKHSSDSIIRVFQKSLAELSSFDSAQDDATLKSLKLMSEGRHGERSRTMKDNKNYNFAELYINDIRLLQNKKIVVISNGTKWSEKSVIKSISATYPDFSLRSK